MSGVVGVLVTDAFSKKNCDPTSMRSAMRRSLFTVVIMLSASAALAAGPNGTAVTTDTGAMMDAAKAAVAQG